MRTRSEFFIMRPFNRLFCFSGAFFLFLLVSAARLLRDKSMKTKQTVLVSACAVTFTGFFLYNYCMSLDEQYAVVNAAMGGFDWWGELPLHLCNVNMMLIPVSVITRNRPLMNFCFFTAPLGAFMALAMPGVCFDGYSILMPRMLGYYGTHFMIVIEGLALAAFGFCRPRFRDMPRTVLAVFAVGAVIFLIDLFLRASGLFAHANYFYMMETEGNFLLEIFHGWLPVPFLYLLPAIPILIIYMTLVTLPFEITDRLTKKDTRQK